MASAKQDFIKRLRTLDVSIRDTEALISRAHTDVTHNEIARMLRNGLAVVGFAALEDFVKKRSSEVMNEIGGSGVPFSELPDKLKEAATYEVVSALSHQLTVRDKSERIDYIQEQAAKISSTATQQYEITEHAFGYSQSNINAETVKKILISLHVVDPWRQISAISSRLGLTALPLIDSYKNAATRRHRAAHVANADTPQGDIAQFVKEAFGIAIGFDVMLSRSLRSIRNYDRDYLSGTKKLEENDVTFRYVKYVNRQWKEYSGESQRAFRVSNNVETLCNDAKIRSQASSQDFVRFDESGLIQDWACS